MTRIPRNQATGLEIIAALVATAVLIGVTIIVVQTLARLPDAFNSANGIIITIVDGSLTFLIMACLMPTWGVVGLECFRLRQQAEQYAAWALSRHPLLEQRAECAIRAAYLALARQDMATATRYAEIGLKVAGVRIDRPVISFYYALCLDVRASFFQDQGRYQEALEDYATATRLNLQPATLTAQYYAAASGPLYWMGRFDEAVLFARQVADAEECPADARVTAYRSAALALAEQECYTEAAAEGRAGIAVTPLCLTRVLLTVDQVWLLTMAGQMEEAAELRALVDAMMTEESLAKWLTPEYSEVQARIEMASEHWASAEALLQAAVQYPGRHAAPCYFLSQLAVRRGDAAQAEVWRERLQRECPESFYARRVREQS